MESESPPTAHTKHGDLTLDQIAECLPGMSRLMVEVSDRYWILYYAAKAGKWDLARHEFSELRKTLRLAALTRPRYQEPLDQFDAEYMKPLEQAIRAKDWPAFDGAYQKGIDGTNENHRTLGYSYIEWQLPDTPPPHLRLAE